MIYYYTDSLNKTVMSKFNYIIVNDIIDNIKTIIIK